MSTGGGGNPYIAAGQAGLSLASADLQATAMRGQAKWERERAKTNAQMIRFQRRDVLERGKEAVAQRESDVRQMIGTQRVNLAAQGIEVDSGVAAQLQQEAREFGDEDIAAIKNSAWKQAWGLEIEERQTLQAGQMAEAAADQNAKMTLLTGGAQAARYGYNAYKG